ncbi:MAG: alpha-glucosidase [Atopobiaceae bacterium]|nr:alpha-glucosidase [Atopobiaceae bacterium]
MATEQRVWWKEAVVYQVYPQSFADSDGDGVGDLNGLTARLPYLAKLGVDVIWLSPVYVSPMDDNGYDVADYRAIQPEYGTLEDFDRMLATAHGLGIKVIMDLVANHTSDEHAWFEESRSSRESPYRDYYVWRDGKDNGHGGTLPPNNWESTFSGSAWEYDDRTGQYYLHCFSKKQPDLNWENPRVREEIYDLMTWWCERGVDGWRMDVISMISKDQSFPDGKPKKNGYGDSGPYVMNGPRVHEFIQEMNKRVLSRFDIMTVGEAQGVGLEQAKQYANAEGTELNMIFQFEHVSTSKTTAGTYTGKWGINKPQMPKVRALLNKWQLGLEGASWNSLFWNNHDQPRAVSRFGNDSPEWREVCAKMLGTCLHFMKGTPYILQGEELGMTNMHFTSLDQCRDVEELGIYQQAVVERGIVTHEQMMAAFDNVARDNCRTPMQWDDSPQAGFTTGTPWIGVNPNYVEINAAAQVDNPNSVFSYYRELIRLRHEMPIVVYGSYVPLLEDSESLWAYERHLDGRVLTVACNWTDAEQLCDLFDADAGERLIGNYAEHKPGVLQPYEAYVTLR